MTDLTAPDSPSAEQIDWLTICDSFRAKLGTRLRVAQTAVELKELASLAKDMLTLEHEAQTLDYRAERERNRAMFRSE
jgi:hypothetical protein